MEKETKKRTGKYIYATGRRKTSIARVRLYKGTGDMKVNGMEAKAYFPTKTLHDKIKQPLIQSGLDDKMDADIKAVGGGKNSQAEAVRHGISRALVIKDEKLKKSLKKSGYLKRDPRMKERKKYGLKRARRAPQWQKR
ncbi:MAG: 30S ribosomal protein S9 [bacterium]